MALSSNRLQSLWGKGRGFGGETLASQLGGAQTPCLRPGVGGPYLSLDTQTPLARDTGREVLGSQVCLSWLPDPPWESSG